MWRSLHASIAALFSSCSPFAAAVPACFSICRKFHSYVADAVTAEVFAFVGRCALGRACMCICVGCDRTRCNTARMQNSASLLVLPGFVLLLLRGLDDTCPVRHRDQTSWREMSLPVLWSSFLHQSADFALLRQR